MRQPFRSTFRGCSAQIFSMGTKISATITMPKTMFDRIASAARRATTVAVPSRIPEPVPEPVRLRRGRGAQSGGGPMPGVVVPSVVPVAVMPSPSPRHVRGV